MVRRHAWELPLRILFFLVALLVGTYLFWPGDEGSDGRHRPPLLPAKGGYDGPPDTPRDPDARIAWQERVWQQQF
jgi:hypothetical protein